MADNMAARATDIMDVAMDTMIIEKDIARQVKVGNRENMPPPLIQTGVQQLFSLYFSFKWIKNSVELGTLLLG